MSATLACIGPCFCCDRLFAFDPDEVPAVPIDPASGLTPDLGGDPDLTVNMPVCARCCRAANAERARIGQGPAWPEARIRAAELLMGIR